jgi:hypothetical protein
MLIYLVEHGVLQPRLNCGFTPTGASNRYADLPGKCAFPDLSVERRPAESGSLKDLVEAKNAFRSRARHFALL